MASRRSEELDPGRVRTNPLLALYQHASRRRFSTPGEYFAWCSKGVAEWVLRKGFGNANALMGFIRNIDPDLFAEAQRRGVMTVGDQMIAPAIVEKAEALRQASRWPEWQDLPALEDLDAMIDLEHRTWRALDHITCASEYVRTSLVEVGADPRRLSVIPYPIDAGQFEFVDRQRREGPVTVGFVGAVNLRKGAPYFLEVARRFAPDRVRFVMVGPVQVSAYAEELLGQRIELLGHIPRSDVRRRLAEFDIYFFPSTCEGSAGSVMEAMASGLPIVSSPNSGTLVRDGLEGFVAPHDDVAAHVTSIERLISDPMLRLRLGKAARQRVMEFSIARYSKELTELFSRLSSPGSSVVSNDPPATSRI